jgi:hypothetical protein
VKVSQTVYVFKAGDKANKSVAIVGVIADYVAALFWL